MNGFENEILQTLKGILFELHNANNNSASALSKLLNSLPNLLSTVIGGMITFFVTSFNLKIQNKNQNIKDKKQIMLAQRKALQIIKDEIFRNSFVNKSYLSYLVANNKDYIDHREGIHKKLRDDSWEEYKGDILSIDDLGITVGISTIYDSFFLFNGRDIIYKNDIVNLDKEIEEIRNLITETVIRMNTDKVK